jgi:adenosylmethionine-8-amino-7-oxononanoate aminotransferase
MRSAAANLSNASPAGNLWHPMANPAEMLAHPPKVMVGGEGVFLRDADDHRVLDAVGGLWNVNLGYSCDPVKEAIARQLSALPYCSSFRGTTSAVAIELSAELTRWFSPEGMVRWFFTSGGSDSVETALKLARQYHKLKGQGDRTKFVSLKRGYHGTHFGAASVNGNAGFRRNYEPLLPGCFHIEAPYAYRNPFGEEDPARLARLCVSVFEDAIAFQGADTIAALILEPVLGAGGVIVPHETFVPSLREICERHGILFIADEVITGFGRAGEWSGSRLWGVKPDIMCTAKAITNGYFPFGAVGLSRKVADVFESDPTAAGGVIGHGYTYSAHPVGAAAALACLPEMKRLDVAANAAVRGEEMLAACLSLKDRHPIVGDVRGKGLMLAIELVSDRTTRQPAAKDLASKVFEHIYRDGVLVRISGNNLILSPPLVINADDAVTIVAAVDRALSSVN